MKRYIHMGSNRSPSKFCPRTTNGVKFYFSFFLLVWVGFCSPFSNSRITTAALPLTFVCKVHTRLSGRLSRSVVRFCWFSFLFLFVISNHSRHSGTRWQRSRGAAGRHSPDMKSLLCARVFHSHSPASGAMVHAILIKTDTFYNKFWKT